VGEYNKKTNMQKKFLLFCLFVCAAAAADDTVFSSCTSGCGINGFKGYLMQVNYDLNWAQYHLAETLSSKLSRFGVDGGSIVYNTTISDGTLQSLVLPVSVAGWPVIPPNRFKSAMVSEFYYGGCVSGDKLTVFGPGEKQNNATTAICS
jgi:hypothetical protein